MHFTGKGYAWSLRLSFKVCLFLIYLHDSKFLFQTKKKKMKNLVCNYKHYNFESWVNFLCFFFRISIYTTSFTIAKKLRMRWCQGQTWTAWINWRWVSALNDTQHVHVLLIMAISCSMYTYMINWNVLHDKVKWLDTLVQTFTHHCWL